MLVVVPNYLRDELNRKLDEQFELHPGAAKDRDELYSQLLAYVNEHGVVPDFTLAKTEAKSAPSGYEPAQVLEGGSVRGPRCCGVAMADDGGCSEGCCDDYRCATCGHRVRIEWPD